MLVTMRFFLSLVCSMGDGLLPTVSGVTQVKSQPYSEPGQQSLLKQELTFIAAVTGGVSSLNDYLSFLVMVG